MEEIDQFGQPVKKFPGDRKTLLAGLVVVVLIIILVFILVGKGGVPISEKERVINEVQNLKPLTQEEKDRVDLMMQTSASPIDPDEKQDIINFTKNL